MRLAHPFPEFIPALRPHLILHHKILEILRANPTRVEFGEERHEGGYVGAVGGGGIGGVGGGEGVQERPGGAAEGFNVRGAVGRELGGSGGGGLGRGEGGFGDGAEGGEGVAGTAAGGGLVCVFVLDL